MAKVIFESEKELEDYICEKLEENKHCPIGDESVDMYFRQLNIGAYGVADIVKISFNLSSPEICITVLELKKEKITLSTIAQVARYMTGIKHFINERYTNKSKYITVFGEVAAPGICTDDDACYLSGQLDNIKIYDISCCLDTGFISSDGGVWVKTEPNFKNLNEASKAIKENYVECKRGCFDSFNNMPARKNT